MEPCDVTLAKGKDVSLAVIAELERQNFPALFALVDSDFDRLNGLSPPSQNVIWGDCHDLETMLIRSEALDKLLQELGSEAKLKAFVHRFGSVRDALLRAAVSIGHLRLYSSQESLNLQFKGLKYNKCLDPATLSVDVDQLITEVKNTTQRQDLDSATLRDGMREIERKGHDAWELCNGHDLVAVLGLGLRGILGSRSARDVTSDVLGRYLRLAYENSAFGTIDTYRQIQDWESRNMCQVLRK